MPPITILIPRLLDLYLRLRLAGNGVGSNQEQKIMGTVLLGGYLIFVLGLDPIVPPGRNIHKMNLEALSGNKDFKSSNATHDPLRGKRL